MSNNELAFFIGLLGSLHCVGMCGPLAFAVPVNRPGRAYLIWNKLIYQLGRICSYCLLGVAAGAFGQQLWNSGLQQVLSIVTGVLVLAAAITMIVKWKGLINPSSFLMKPFNRLFSFAFSHKANHLIIGMINGLLPCGFVYLALGGAINTGSVANAVSYMFWFGAGTAPLMFLATAIVGLGSFSFRKKITGSIPYVMLVLGSWFILRGLELDIPYLSPQKPGTEAAVCR